MNLDYCTKGSINFLESIIPLVDQLNIARIRTVQAIELGDELLIDKCKRKEELYENTLLNTLGINKGIIKIN